MTFRDVEVNERLLHIRPAYDRPDFQTFETIVQLASTWRARRNGKLDLLSSLQMLHLR